MRAENENFGCDIGFCGALCCSNCAVLTEEEVAGLVANVRRVYDFELDLRKYFRQAKGEHGMYYAVKRIKGRCIFLDKEKHCRIYKCRPTLCELYPVVDVNQVDERCPIVHKLPEEKLVALKGRYAEEIDERIQSEQRFMFV